MIYRIELFIKCDALKGKTIVFVKIFVVYDVNCKRGGKWHPMVHAPDGYNLKHCFNGYDNISAQRIRA